MWNLCCHLQGSGLTHQSGIAFGINNDLLFDSIVMDLNESLEKEHYSSVFFLNKRTDMNSIKFEV